MIKKAAVTILLTLSLLLTGCWNSIEMNEVIMVMGAGLDKTEKGYEMSVEALRSSGGPAADETQNKGMVISMEGETLFDCIRSMIRKTKRRLFFTHTNIWVVSEQLASHNFTEAMDLLRRDQMPRLNSLLLITPEQPKDILASSTISEDITSVEMSESLHATEYTSQFQPMELRKVFEMLSGPVPATFIPIIQTHQTDDQVITELTGTALIKNDKMIGKLNVLETKGLLYLRGEAGAGSITTEVKPGQKVSIEVEGEQINIEPTLRGEQLSVDVEIETQGTLSDVPTNMEVNEKTIHQIEELLSQEGRERMEMLLKKLQKELKTDVVDFGLHVYRKYPQQWHSLKDDWDDIFSKAEVNLNIKTSIYHRGLMDQSSGGIYDKPQFIPFFFLDDES